MGYIKQLDALRALAIFSVLCHHWLPKSHVLHKISSVVSAPNIFFTISGFLITYILLKDRERAESLQTGKHQVFIDFFLKRSLRIFPAYYLTLLVCYLLRPESVPRYGPYLNFTANFEIYHNQSFGKVLGHLWSMSVEQQFYIFWPLLILFIPKRFILHTIVAFILIGIISQNIIPRSRYVGVLPQTCFDTLGIGALLAWVVLFRKERFTQFYKILRALGLISLFLVASQVVWGDFNLFIHHRTLIAIIVIWLIAFFILEGNEGKSPLGIIFNNKILFLIGKMSYGIYLYHLPLYNHIHTGLRWANQFMPLPGVVIHNLYFYIFESLVVLFILSWLSLKFYELPLSNLKRYLKKEKPARAVPQTA